MFDLAVIRTTYTDVVDGEPVDPDTSITLVEDLELHEAITYIRNRGLTFTATGTDYAADPDGSTIVSYATGEREEVTIHPQGMWWPCEYAALVAGVDAPADASLSFGYLVQPADRN